MSLYVDYRFKSLTPAQLKPLDDIVVNIMRKFTIIYADSEPTVYKIVNYLFDNHKLDEKYIKTLDGVAIECYFDITAKPKYNHIQMQNILEKGVLSDVANKILVIPLMTNNWNKELAFYFYNELKYAGCLGIIFYSKQNNQNSFGRVLLRETTLDVLQFPHKHCSDRKVIEDNEW